MSEAKLVSAEHLSAGMTAVLGIDPAQAPSDPEKLNERLTLPQKGVTQALGLLLAQSNSKHMSRATPIVYGLLEAAGRAFPAEMKDEIALKGFVTSITAVGREATETVKHGTPAPEIATTRARQPALVAFLDEQFLSPTSFAQKFTPDERIGLYALCLGTVRAIDRALVGAEKPAVAAKVPGRNDPCSCGSGKKYKKCHGAAA